MPIVVRKGIGRGIVPIYLQIKVLQISRKLSKDAVVLRLGDGKAIAAEADEEVGGLKESIDNLDNLPAYVCGLLNTQAREGFSYFIIFTDDNSRYGYVYLRYKSEAFVRFKDSGLKLRTKLVAKLKSFGQTEIDVKTAFLNGFDEEEIYIDQLEGFTIVGEEQRLVGALLYVDDILLIRDDIKMLGDTKAWLSTQFSMKDLGEAFYILGIKIFRDRSKRNIRNDPKLTNEEFKRMFDIPYASAIGSIQYVVQCTRPDSAYALSVTTRYKACAKEAHWTAVKTILKYLRRTKDVFLVYGGGELILEGFRMLASSRTMMMQNHSLDLYSCLTVVWWLGRVPIRIPQLIPP
ncbi:Copia protein [Sesamum angolense]|uniref:Copia protein n=1 Tax=Sesamum angolense TaxID=2727404 RepID=A0AAE1X9U2_9LAMI|nr:Copia protein [Sesamum angolense]